MLIIKTLGQYAAKAGGAAILGAILGATYLLWQQHFVLNAGLQSGDIYHHKDAFTCQQVLPTLSVAAHWEAPGEIVCVGKTLRFERD